MSRILITGAGGFVGKALAQHYVRTEDVAVIVRDDEPYPIQDYQAYRGSFTDMALCSRAINEFRPDVVFHLGAQAMVGVAKRDPFDTMESNVRGTYTMLEAFHQHRAPGSVMVIASSDKAYGETRVYADGRAPYEESDPLLGRGIYDCSKSCADMIAQSYGRSYGIPIGIVRAGNIYGPGDRDTSRIIPAIVDDIKNNRQPTIMSDGTPVRDYLYISDAVDGYARVANHMRQRGGAEAFNISGGEPISVRDLVERIRKVAKHLGLDPRPMEIKGTRTGEIQHQALDTTKARTRLAWEPQTTLDEGIRWTLTRMILDGER